MADTCHMCPKPHGNLFFHKVGFMVYWFCSLRCKERFRDALRDSPQREYMETGGWQ